MSFATSALSWRTPSRAQANAIHLACKSHFVIGEQPRAPETLVERALHRILGQYWRDVHMTLPEHARVLVMGPIGSGATEFTAHLRAMGVKADHLQEIDHCLSAGSAMSLNHFVIDSYDVVLVGVLKDSIAHDTMDKYESWIPNLANTRVRDRWPNRTLDDVGEALVISSRQHGVGWFAWLVAPAGVDDNGTMPAAARIFRAAISRKPGADRAADLPPAWEHLQLLANMYTKVMHGYKSIASETEMDRLHGQDLLRMADRIDSVQSDAPWVQHARVMCEAWKARRAAEGELYWGVKARALPPGPWTAVAWMPAAMSALR